MEKIDCPSGLVDRPPGMFPLTLRQMVCRRLCQPASSGGGSKLLGPALCSPRRSSTSDAADELMGLGRAQQQLRLHARLRLARL